MEADSPAALLIEPLGILHGAAARAAVLSGQALRLAGDFAAFALCREGGDGPVYPATAAPTAWNAALSRLSRPVPRWAGLPADRPAVMGILNVTPDSFSDGGRFLDVEAAVEAGLAMAAAGADIVDVGGESTRPGADPISPDDELARVAPVIRRLADAGVKVSVDTRRAATMAAALDKGAAIVNDISALSADPAALRLVAARGCPVVLMHMRGEPRTMQSHAKYSDVATEVTAALALRLRAAEEAGIDPALIALDPGIGFAKTGAHNAALLDRLSVLLNLGCRVLVGVSRKAFIGHLAGAEMPAAARDHGSIAAGLFALARGASILRVHDVPGTVQALRVWAALALGYDFPLGREARGR